MTKINRVEYGVLKEIKRNGYEEIARNVIGEIMVRVTRENVSNNQYQTEHNDKFKFIEATGNYWSIAELIEEYEIENVLRDNEPEKWILDTNLEITEEQALEVIHDKCGDEVLQNNIDYVESQGYVVIEKPTVPQFVEDWYVQNKHYLPSEKFERIADWEDKKVVDWYERCLGRHKNNVANAQETIALMDLVGYEVEKEPKYYAKVKGWGINGNDGHAYYSGKFPLSLTTTTESVAHTKDEWKNYGVYEDNADFLKANELEK